ncbi:hypothetical protein CEN40_12125 [Fischerella thermalis CCMEE 5205]|uniref:Uncharacterized protein n=1 Tax=Fischerella thermalis CCMEE 5318 TaxID=2019666 RepID=A0A2N6L6V4_9CYAN|nr:hypothetical protein [Fischerella thermalis]PMB17628.1 hypothetical protein CEN46_23075 [Fischerella thermalis CCMEE 5318]PMB39436.1 hypothetical protein CEN47_04990 [Fischerella thermalis CCMEE 5319]PMB45432.1 hypothetical protein CEN40_12125 [Fischerella thermalis CCMEE 5205]
MKRILIFFIIAFVVCSSTIAVASQLNSNHLLAQNTTSTEEFIARGTEPFWSVTVSKKNGIVYSTPENRKLTFPYVTPLQASGRPKDLLRVYRLRGKTNNTLIIKKEDACSDGMSDIQYPYSATLILGNTVLEGCAQRK